MPIISFALYLVFGILCLAVGVIVPFFIVAAIFCAPYWLYLGCYKHDNNLPDDFRKTGSMLKEVKYAAKFYWDLLHLRKPTF